MNRTTLAAIAATTLALGACADSGPLPGPQAWTEEQGRVQSAACYADATGANGVKFPHSRKPAWCFTGNVPTEVVALYRAGKRGDALRQQ